MKNRKAGVGRRGVSGIEIIIIAAIAIITIVLSIIIPVAFLKIHVVRVVEIQYGYNNAELALLTLLSDKDIYEKISLHVADLGDDIGPLLKARLDNLVPSKCYKLSYNGKVIVQREPGWPKTCDLEFSANSYIALPYGRNSEKITLEIG